MHPSQKIQEILNHRTAAHHLKEAARHHIEAALYLENGDTKMAIACTLKANKYIHLARAAQQEEGLFQNVGSYELA